MELATNIAHITYRYLVIKLNKLGIKDIEDSDLHAFCSANMMGESVCAHGSMDICKTSLLEGITVNYEVRCSSIDLPSIRLLVNFFDFKKTRKKICNVERTQSTRGDYAFIKAAVAEFIDYIQRSKHFNTYKKRKNK